MTDLMRVTSDLWGGKGTTSPQTAGLSSALRVQDAHGALTDAALGGRLYTAANVAAQAVSVALATTYTGLCVSNPLGNKWRLVMLGCNYALSVAPAAIAPLFLLTGSSVSTDVTHTTPLATPGIQSALVGGLHASTAKADSAATIPTPTYRLSMGSGFTAGALYGTTPNWIDLKGSLIIEPGGFICWGALTAVTGFGSFMWEEVPIV